MLQILCIILKIILKIIVKAILFQWLLLFIGMLDYSIRVI